MAELNEKELEETSGGMGNPFIYYTVKPGDCLSVIAQKYGTTVQQIAKDNNIANVDRIRADTVLIIRKK